MHLDKTMFRVPRKEEEKEKSKKNSENNFDESVFNDSDFTKLFEEKKIKKEIKRKISKPIGELEREGVLHVGPAFETTENISGFKKINEIEDETENGDVEIGGKKLKSRVLSKLGRFLPSFISKKKNLSMLPRDEVDEGYGGSHRWQERIENLKTLNKQKPKENSVGVATISKLARQNRGKIRKEVLHNPNAWENYHKEMYPEDFLSE
jgi:hypothetical protein